MWNGLIASGERDEIDDDSDVDDAGNGTDDDSDGNTDEFLGHGNHVASLIAAAAPDVSILPIRVLDDDGNGTLADLADGIDYARTQGVDVINLSLVVPNADSTLKTAVTDAIDAGIVIVSAAGSAADDLFDTTWLQDRSITVGAVDGSDARCSWSPNGTGVDVYAPGLGLLGALDVRPTAEFGEWDGTSFACALASAAAAIALENDNTLDPETTRDHLMDTSATITGATPSSRGRIDLAEIVD